MFNLIHQDTVIGAVKDCFPPAEVAGVYAPGDGGGDAVLVLFNHPLAPSARRRLTRDLRERIDVLSDQKIPVRVGCEGVVDPDSWSRKLRGANAGAVRID
jgi:hypothetical protein